MARRRKNDGSGPLILLVGGVLVLGWIVQFVSENITAVITVVAIAGIIGLLVVVARRIEVSALRREAAREEERFQRETAADEERLQVLRLSQIQQRRAALVYRFGDERVADHIMDGRLWMSMTKEQLVEAWGHPDDVKTTYQKTKIKEEYRYDRVGVNRFLRRAFLENDVVVKWQE